MKTESSVARAEPPPEDLLPTFRDPAGSLSIAGEFAIRTIHPSSREEVLAFLASEFYLRAEARGDIVSTVVEDSSDGLTLLHPRVPVPTYPWEWTSSQWRVAARLTLDLCEQALAEGWMLKDATPLNILFVGARPVLVDVLSFERWAGTSSLWLAYGQYTRTFLLPLVMNRLVHWPLELSFFRRDGYEPAELYEALRWRQRLSRTALWPITLPTWLDRRKGASEKAAAAVKQGGDPELNAHILKRTLASLRRSTEAAMPEAAGSAWAEYVQTSTHYTAADNEAKHAWVTGVLERLRPAFVLDIGANTGEYSVLAASKGAQVVALERDAAAAERLFLRTRDEQRTIQTIQTIHADLARPTPAAGWENREASSLLSRLAGRFDLVMMLAVIHHLLLMEQIPLGAILALCHRLTKRYLIVEWVPVSDPMFQSLMRGRDSLYGHLSEESLRAAGDGLFREVERFALQNGRILYLFEKTMNV